MRIAPVMALVTMGLVAAWMVSPGDTQDHITTDVQPASPITTAPQPASPEPYAERPAAVGWVFGRLMGFPGADRPLMSGSYPTMPPAAWPAPADAGSRR